MSEKRRWLLGVMAAAALSVAFLGQVSLIGDVPLVSLRSADGLDSTVVVALMVFAGWAGLSALLGQLLIPSVLHPPVPRTEGPTSSETFEENVEVEMPKAADGVSSAFEAFEKDEEYYRADGAAHEFYLVASTSAAEEGISFPDRLRWWGRTRPDRVPQRGRPNHYFAFEIDDDRDNYLVYEVRHNGRAGGGASYGKPRRLTIPKTAIEGNS